MTRTQTHPEIRLYGANWCPDCRRSKAFLGEHRIAYQYIDIEQDVEAQEYVKQQNDNKQIIPTIVFPDSSILVEPTNAELAEKLGLQTKAKREFYDLIIVGGPRLRCTPGDFINVVKNYCLLGTPQQCVERLQEYIDAGARHIIFSVACPREDRARHIETIAGEIIPHFQ